MSDFITTPIATVSELEKFKDKEGTVTVRFLVDFETLLVNDFESNLDYFTEQVMDIPGHSLMDFTYSVEGVHVDGSLIIEVVGSIDVFFSEYDEEE